MGSICFTLGVVGVKNGGPKSRKNGPRVWAFCKIEFPGIQKPVQFFGQKSAFFKKCGNRGVGVIWLGFVGLDRFLFIWLLLIVLAWVVVSLGCYFVVWLVW